ncbi:hypothetical protein HUU62_14755 [Rhodoferax sp. 4810]|nr:hypothetical protein [Rhodoferax jenense]
MKSSLAVVLTALFAANTGFAMAQNGEERASPSEPVLQGERVNQPAAVMSHDVASLMQSLQQARVQYRRSGQPQDLARVEAVRRELAERGFGRVKRTLPVMTAGTN